MNRVATQPLNQSTLRDRLRLHSVAVGGLLVLLAVALCGPPRPLTPAELSDGRHPATLSLELNIPAFRFDVRAESTLVRSFPVAVGMRRYKTPTGDFEISRIIWNPWWFPPDAEWASRDSITRPGPTNPMGKVKLLFNGPYYLHGTPLPGSLGRAASHGCVRMRNEDAVELAKLVHLYGTAPISDALLDSLTSAWKTTRTFEVISLIPVTIVYRAAEVRDSALIIYPDVYRRHREGLYGPAMSALIEAGYDTAAVDAHLVRLLLRRAASTAASISVDQLLLPADTGGIPP